MNKETVIQVQTPVGLTQTANTGEGVGQGTLEGAIVSAVNLDNGVREFFRNSEYEISYGGLQLGPMLYQDDVARMANDPSSVQFGNDKMEAVAESKLLDFNLKKSSYLLIGKQSSCRKIEQQLELQPITLCGQNMKRDKEAKYLGDWISQEGLAKSAAITVMKRKKAVLSAIHDIRAVVDDHRSSICGGLVVGLQIWEMAIIPMLLYNSECWLDLSENTLVELENLQNCF